MPVDDDPHENPDLPRKEIARREDIGAHQEWPSWSWLSHRFLRASVALAMALSVVALIVAFRASNTAALAKECSVLVAQVQDVGDIRGAAERVQLTPLTEAETLMFRARLSEDRANLLAALNEEECVEDLKRYRTESTLHLVNDALQKLGPGTALPKPPATSPPTQLGKLGRRRAFT
ncbi:hypothetical protein AB0D97_33715 [Streptomyces roseus]|uniref:hypothetical protein n=1 Tax=Streptomyces roseus TaxID=66430 RepID=UPI0033C2645C